MTKLRRLDITVTNPENVVYPGQVIQGQIEVELWEGMRMKGIHVRCEGKGKVAWNGDNDVWYKEKEYYIGATLTVFGNAPEHLHADRHELEKGLHIFPFQFVLPTDIPGSFEYSKDCYVCYWVDAKIYKQFTEKGTKKVYFTVGSYLDLNTVQGASDPVQGSASKTLCCCCCESGPVNAFFSIDKKGYVPGEAILCTAEINEGSGQGVEFSQIVLIMTATMNVKKGNHTKDVSKECTRVTRGAISPGGSDVFTGERLVVPNVPASFLPGCGIIDISYQIQLSLLVNSAWHKLRIPLDIIIGTVPLQSAIHQYTPMPQFEVITQQPYSIAMPVNKDMPPPSYTDACNEYRV